MTALPGVLFAVAVILACGSIWSVKRDWQSAVAYACAAALAGWIAWASV